MDDDPIIYGPAISTYVRTVRLALEEKRVSYRLVEVDILKGEAQSPEHLLRHPFGRVPAFEYDDLVLYETGAIVRFIDREFPGVLLHPVNIRACAQMDQVVAIIDNYGYPRIIGDLVIQRLVVPLLGGSPDMTIVEDALPACKHVLAVLDGMVGDGGYLAGDALSLADLAVIPVYDYCRQVPEGAKLLARFSNLKRWWQNVSPRPSVIQTRAALNRRDPPVATVSG